MPLLQTLFGNIPTTVEASPIVAQSVNDNRAAIAAYQCSEAAEHHEMIVRCHAIVLRCQQEIECIEFCSDEPNENRRQLIADIKELLHG